MKNNLALSKKIDVNKNINNFIIHQNKTREKLKFILTISEYNSIKKPMAQTEKKLEHIKYLNKIYEKEMSDIYKKLSSLNEKDLKDSNLLENYREISQKNNQTNELLFKCLKEYKNLNKEYYKKIKYIDIQKKIYNFYKKIFKISFISLVIFSFFSNEKIVNLKDTSSFKILIISLTSIYFQASFFSFEKKLSKRTKTFSQELKKKKNIFSFILKNQTNKI